MAADGEANGRHHRDGETVHLAELLREAQAELLRRTEAATAWQVRAEVLAHQLAEAQGRIRALEAPKEPEPAPVPEPSPYPAPTDPPANGHEPRPWWARWWGWLNGS